ncbi:zinc finger protein [Cricetulus griseus]|uniref:Zinc finger protein n=1 Tax=Cricetulus griseus TaxID=10029 RepID=A0A061IN15_CRIGR|nr:zinc finger protein [Cricetulus griseus]
MLPPCGVRRQAAEILQDSSGISRITDGISGIFSDHCYSVCSMRQPDLKYFDNKDDDSDPETSNDLPKFTDGTKGRNRNQNYLVPSPVLRILDHTVFSTGTGLNKTLASKSKDACVSSMTCKVTKSKAVT